jgi:hypothetical protein
MIGMVSRLCQSTVARTCVLLLLAAELLSCRSAPVEAQAGGELGPVKILLYAELKDATYGWLGDERAPANIEPVTLVIRPTSKSSKQR